MGILLLKYLIMKYNTQFMKFLNETWMVHSHCTLYRMSVEKVKVIITISL